MPVVDTPNPIVVVTLALKPTLGVSYSPNAAILSTGSVVQDNHVNAAAVDASAVAVSVAPNRGPKGDPGTPGAPGSSVTGFSQIFAPASVWTVAHNLNRPVSVNVYDSAGTQVFGEIHIVDSNTLTVSFSAAFAGTAYVI